MKERFLRLAFVVLAAAGFAACDEDVEAPVGETSTVNVSVYVEVDGTPGLGAGDDPIVGAEVDLVHNETGTAVSATTGANGIATFSNVAAGVYTATHEPATPITNATLTGTDSITVVAQFEGGTTEASFVYSYEPGTISGQFFRDDNDNDTYETDEDTTFAGFGVELFAGTDTSATPIDTETSGDDGSFEFTGLAMGDYTIVIVPLIGTEVVDTTLAVTVSAGATTDLLIEFTGGEAVTPIGDARLLPAGTTVTVEGVVTAGNGVFNSTSVYLQDNTGGIVLFTGGSSAPDVTIGDSIRVTGTTGAFSGEIQISGGASLEVDILGEGTIPEPRTVTATDVLAGDFQGELVVANALTIDSVGAPFSGGNFNVRVSDATGSFIVFFDADSGILPEQVIEGEMYNITGIMTRFNAVLEIKPRSQADLELTSNPGGVLDIGLARLLSDGETVSVTGVVTAAPGAFSSTTLYVQDSTGGIALFAGGTGGPDVSGLVVGDSVDITGTTGTFSAERQISGAAALTITDVGDGTVPTPVSVDAANVNAAQFQGSLAVADSVEVISVSVSGSGNITVVVADDAGEFTVFGDVDTGLVEADFVVGSSYSITGVLASFQSSSTNPPLFQIKPRSPADVTAL